MKYQFPVIVIALCILAGATTCQAAEVVWTVTKSGEGHQQLTVLTNCKPEMDAIITQAKNYLSTNSSKTLVLYFPTNTYIFNNSAVEAMKVRDLTNGAHLTFRGDGTNATAIIHNNMWLDGQTGEHCFYLINANNITVEKMHIQGAAPLVSQGSVTEITAGHIKFQLHTGFPDPVYLFDAAGTNNERTLIHFTHADDQDPHLAPNANKIALGDLTSLGSGLYDALLLDTNQVADLQTNDWVALKTKCGSQGVRIWFCNDTVVQDVLFTQQGGSVLTLGINERTVVRRIRIDRPAPRNGKGFCFSEPTGGPQIENRGPGTVIQNCTIIATADDGMKLGPCDLDPANLPSGLIEGNTVRDNQARGILVQPCYNTTIRGNTLIRNNDCSIWVCTMDAFTSPSTGVMIDSNTFNECWTESVILISTSSSTNLDDNIDVQNNIFNLAPKNNCLIEMDNVNVARVNNNIVNSYSPEEDIPSAGVPQPAPLLYVSYGMNVTGTNNTSVPTTRPTVTVADSNPGTVNVAWSGSTLTYVTLNSIAAEDGYILESTQTSNVGGLAISVNAANNNTGLRVGDETNNCQYKSIVSFDTSGIPSNAVVYSATLSVKRPRIPLGDPSNLGALTADIKSGGFGGNTALAASDFQAAADATNVVTLPYPDINGYISGDLTNGLSFVNKTGKTQLRIHFAIGDNNNAVSDCLYFSSGDNVGDEPHLVIAYGPPAPPAAQDQSLTATDGNPLPITLLATDTQTNALTYHLVSLPTNGLLIGTPPSLVYLPKKGVNGSDTFTFNAYDGIATGNTATVSISLVFIDSNSNGIPDSWEAAYGLTNGINGANADPDGDGASNYAEYMAGTDPTNKASVFAITSLQTTGSSNVVIQWNSAQYHFYSVLSSTNLLNGWNPLITNRIATPPQNVYTGIVNQSGSVFYRIRLDQ